MITTAYKKQVALLLSVLPEVGKEECFALHGGTAINLFVREMPRLSVDIDLTYIPIEDRMTSIAGINNALGRIKTNLERAMPDVSVIEQKEKGKLQISRAGVKIKLEVNLVGRGTLGSCPEMPLCRKAQEEFDAFCAIRIVPFEQLYGGKICAALDRQHPRDLFDVKYLLENEGFTDRIKRGFIYCLLGSDRPLHEIIIPNFQDQRSALENHFAGMSAEEFTYEEYESERLKLVEAIRGNLNDEDKRFLLGFCSFEPDWDVYDFKGYPSVEWKLRNLQKLKEVNPQKFEQQIENLKETLSRF